jgi:hypothetical protein
MASDVVSGFIQLDGVLRVFVQELPDQQRARMRTRVDRIGQARSIGRWVDGLDPGVGRTQVAEMPATPDPTTATRRGAIVR